MNISQTQANFYGRNKLTRPLDFSSMLQPLKEIRFKGRRLDLIGFTTDSDELILSWQIF
jgi:hypothetical protein